MAVQPFVYVEPPTLELLPHGLFEVAQPLDADEHWQMGGVEWESLASYGGGAFYASGIDAMLSGSHPSKTLSDGLPTSKAHPFTVYAGIDCGTIGRPPADFRERSLRILDLASQHAAETALWTGTGDSNVAPVLTGTATTVTTGPTSLTDAVGLLEEWLGNNYNARGNIHAGRRLAAHASRFRQSHRAPGEGAGGADCLVTGGGSRWVFGAGYPGTAPGGGAAPAGSVYIYATGQVFIARTPAVAPASFEQAMNRTLNRVAVLAEQNYLIGIDGPVAAAQVDVSGVNIIDGGTL